MSELEKHAQANSPDRVEALFRNAVARERPPASYERQVRERLEAEWRTATRRRFFYRTGFATAAAAVLATILVLYPRPDPVTEPAGPPVQLARVVTVEGMSRLRAEEQAAATLVGVGEVLTAGQEIVLDAPARLALRWRDGSSVRIGGASRLRLTLQGEVDLVSGRVYVDAAGAAAGATAPVILTPAGRVVHVGTQYMTIVDGGSTRIRVREGRVSLASDGSRHAAGAGQELSTVGGSEPGIRSIAVYGAQWAWAESLAPPFESDGRSISELLDWAGRETGRRIEYLTAEAADVAASTELRGTVRLEPLRAVELVLPTGNLEGEVHNGVISVRLTTG